MYDKDLVAKINAKKQYVSTGKWVISWLLFYLNLKQINLKVLLHTSFIKLLFINLNMKNSIIDNHPLRTKSIE